jgi:hypothetical protein
MVHLVIGSNFSSARSCSLVEDVNFRLPDIVRLAWVSEEARSAHQPQIERVRKAWNSVEWHSILSDIRPCACIVTSPNSISLLTDEVSAQGLELYPLRVVEFTAKQRNDSSVLIDAVIGRRRDAQLFVKAWKRRDTEEMGRLLGYPRCCREFLPDCLRAERTYRSDVAICNEYECGEARGSGDSNTRDTLGELSVTNDRSQCCAAFAVFVRLCRVLRTWSTV